MAGWKVPPQMPMPVIPAGSTPEEAALALVDWSSNVYSWSKGLYYYFKIAHPKIRDSAEGDLNAPFTHTGDTFGALSATPSAQLAHIADAVTSHAITDPADTPADADALRDDLVANTIPSIEAKLDALATVVNSGLVTPETFGFRATS